MSTLTRPPGAQRLATFYALYATKPRAPIVAHVCDDIACRVAGAEGICDDLTRAVGPAGEAARDGRISWLRSPCLGLCDLAPAVLVTGAGETPSRSGLAPVDARLPTGHGGDAHDGQDRCRRAAARGRRTLASRRLHARYLAVYGPPTAMIFPPENAMSWMTAPAVESDRL